MNLRAQRPYGLGAAASTLRPTLKSLTTDPAVIAAQKTEIKELLATLSPPRQDLPGQDLQVFKKTSSATAGKVVLFGALGLGALTTVWYLLKR